MSGLVKSTRSTSLSTPSASTPSAPGVQQHTSDYTGNAIKTWEEFSVMNGLGDGEQADSLVQEPRTIKRAGVFYQKRILWSAFKRNIVYAVILRKLTRRDDGKLAPTGDWTVETQNVYPASKPPSIRKGFLKNAYAPTDGNGGGTDYPADPFLADSEHALSLLPGEVQKQVRRLRAKDSSHVFSGGSSGYADSNGRLTKENVHILIVSGETALVITGTRKNALSASDTAESSIEKMNEQDWHVKQLTYDLSPEQATLTGKQRKGIEA